MTDLLLPSFPNLFLGFLVWIAIPLIASISVAGQRDLIVGPAALLAIVGGWIGLVMVIVFYREPLIPRANKRETPADRAGPFVGGSLSELTDEDLAARLRRLQRLKDEGLITEEEYTTRRAQVLETV